jgi:hypothetical protein
VADFPGSRAQLVLRFGAVVAAAILIMLPSLILVPGTWSPAEGYWRVAAATISALALATLIGITYVSAERSLSEHELATEFDLERFRIFLRPRDDAVSEVERITRLRGGHLRQCDVEVIVRCLARRSSEERREQRLREILLVGEPET